MENEESEFSFLNMILKDFLSNFCHCCIENICNEALKSIYRLRIEPDKMVSCYLMFLREKILNTEIECKYRPIGCKDRIMFGELRHHLRECKYNPNQRGKIEEKEIEENIDISVGWKLTPELISYSELTISSSSSSIINAGTKKTNKINNKKKKHKKNQY
jgi:hypothetical protein